MLWKIKEFVYFCGSVQPIYLRTLVSTQVSHLSESLEQNPELWSWLEHVLLFWLVLNDNKLDCYITKKIELIKFFFVINKIKDETNVA